MLSHCQDSAAVTVEQAASPTHASRTGVGKGSVTEFREESGRLQSTPAGPLRQLFSSQVYLLTRQARGPSPGKRPQNVASCAVYVITARPVNETYYPAPASS